MKTKTSRKKENVTNPIRDMAVYTHNMYNEYLLAGFDAEKAFILTKYASKILWENLWESILGKGE